VDNGNSCTAVKYITTPSINKFKLSTKKREKVIMGDKSPKNKEKRKKKTDTKKKAILPASPVKAIDQKK
jgi:hypothetical protein